jgi:hypothetical protein
MVLKQSWLISGVGLRENKCSEKIVEMEKVAYWLPGGIMDFPVRCSKYPGYGWCVISQILPVIFVVH